MYESIFTLRVRDNKQGLPSYLQGGLAFDGTSYQFNGFSLDIRKTFIFKLFDYCRLITSCSPIIIMVIS